MNEFLFLDDSVTRNPEEYLRIIQEQYRDMCHYDLIINRIEVVRNYNDFVCYIETHGLPHLVSFDHDLGKEHYQEYMRAKNMGREINYDNFTEKTGLDCARYLIEYCRKNKLKLPYYFVHSFNISGKENIYTELNKFDKNG